MHSSEMHVELCECELIGKRVIVIENAVQYILEGKL